MTINYQQPIPGYYPFSTTYPTQPVAPFTAPFIPPTQNPFMEQSYIENILRLNLGKNVNVYMSFEGSQWGSKIFRGELLAAGKDHIIIRDNQTKTTYLLLSIYLSYITFDESIEYEYPYAQTPN